MMTNDYDQSLVLYQRGVIALEANDFQRAVKLFEESIQNDPHYKTHHRLAEVYRDVREPGQEGKHLELGYRLNSSNDKLAIHYAEWLVAQSRAEEALKIVEQTLSRNSTYGPAKRLLERIEKP